MTPYPEVEEEVSGLCCTHRRTGIWKEQQKKTSKFNLHFLGVGRPCAKCTSHPEQERDGNQLALESTRPPKRGPLGPHSERKNVYRLNQINTSGPLWSAGCFISSLQSRRLFWVCLRLNSWGSRLGCMYSVNVSDPICVCVWAWLDLVVCVQYVDVYLGMCPCVWPVFSRMR